jgi:hypothetical protein
VAVRGFGCYHIAQGSTRGGEERLRDGCNKSTGPIEGAAPETATSKKKKYRHRFSFLQIIIFHNFFNIKYSFFICIVTCLQVILTPTCRVSVYPRQVIEVDAA